MRIVSIILILLVCCSCSSRKAWIKARQQYFITYHERADGQAVLSGVSSGSSEERSKIQAYIGSTIIVDADCDWSNETNTPSSLHTRAGVKIAIDDIPYRDIRPREGCGSWTAEVRGALKNVD